MISHVDDYDRIAGCVMECEEIHSDCVAQGGLEDTCRVDLNDCTEGCDQCNEKAGVTVQGY